MALKFTVHGVQSFIKGHRKSGVISIKHSRDITSPHSMSMQSPWSSACMHDGTSAIGYYKHAHVQFHWQRKLLGASDLSRNEEGAHSLLASNPRRNRAQKGNTY